MHGKYTDMGKDHPVGIAAIQADLTNNIGRMLPDLQEETAYALDREIGRCPHWTQLVLYKKLQQLSAMVNGRMFVGLPLCRDQGWIDLLLAYTLHLFAAISSIQKVHPWLRSIVAPWTAAVRQLTMDRTTAIKMLRSHIDAAVAFRRDCADGPGARQYNNNQQYNLISWMLKQMDLSKKVDHHLLAKEQLFAGEGICPNLICFWVGVLTFPVRLW